MNQNNNEKTGFNVDQNFKFSTKTYRYCKPHSISTKDTEIINIYLSTDEIQEKMTFGWYLTVAGGSALGLGTISAIACGFFDKT
ncbi:putative membrane protein [Candidatus Ichthyocystis hellenicum]|uniref:Putative membrane protein n=1 Tax=Candidatus Ichthyocystis hellenicum TaxID=1561003 RepID=A0A0S4M720_9BURK|nr:hypothetical protein [Candidatus Ichthyocystis hellenicum]CUT18070.1 putative membrane protein [Candidatus Ichthyocystis hellenicum]